jgi:hypothetical protein
MKKLLVYLMSLMFLMSITIIGKPATGEYKGEDFFVVDYGTPDGAITGFWYKDGVMQGFANSTKDQIDKNMKKQPQKSKMVL